jgi:hypothetical protein
MTAFAEFCGFLKVRFFCLPVTGHVITNLLSPSPTLNGVARTCRHGIRLEDGLDSLYGPQKKRLVSLRLSNLRRPHPQHEQ